MSGGVRGRGLAAPSYSILLLNKKKRFFPTCRYHTIGKISMLALIKRESGRKGRQQKEVI
jgi:hypothetical protein